MSGGLNPIQQGEVDSLIFAGRKIEAIKRYRELVSTGLAEAKHAIDAREKELRAQSPQSFAARQGGCLSIILIGIVGLALLACAGVKLLA